MSEHPHGEALTDDDGDESEAVRSGVTSQEFGNLTVEDDATGTVNPADLAGTAGPGDDG